MGAKTFYRYSYTPLLMSKHMLLIKNDKEWRTFLLNSDDYGWSGNSMMVHIPISFRKRLLGVGKRIANKATDDIGVDLQFNSCFIPVSRLSFDIVPCFVFYMNARFTRHRYQRNQRSNPKANVVV